MQVDDCGGNYWQCRTGLGRHGLSTHPHNSQDEMKQRLGAIELASLSSGLGSSTILGRTRGMGMGKLPKIATTSFLERPAESGKYEAPSASCAADNGFVQRSQVRRDESMP